METQNTHSIFSYPFLISSFQYQKDADLKQNIDIKDANKV